MSMPEAAAIPLAGTTALQSLRDHGKIKSGQSVLIPLINSAPITGMNSAALNVRETYTIDIVRGDRRTGATRP